jgi:hypothetical protein
MKILGVDASTKTGFSLFHDGALIDYGLISTPIIHNPLQDLKYYEVAEHQAESIGVLILEHDPDFIIIEQTNQGRSRDTQKSLEFIHCLFLQMCRWIGVEEKVIYVDTSHWRSALGITLSKEQRLHNKEVKKKTVRGKITPKHLSVEYVNKRFNKNFILKDNDITDSICLGLMADHLNLSTPQTGFALQDLESAFA